ncbi:MAG: DUF86 domain-containing protein [Chiayiivirga sp.]|uniref:type VII toxin-antitoxin system HepT family RNase toxin n=1 Tax=Chiayiivirga sp. TaxID=2041042 RepID=UPI0025C377B5|nr:DUF86 domain-containing protein [Chiayiivirga sp.]MCI1729405.1 DUF86 domain-containing protein [Chiayiivirga sp.]
MRTSQQVAALVADPDAQDVLVLNLSRAVPLCLDLAAHRLAHLSLPAPETMGQAFDRLFEAGVINEAICVRMKKAVGVRNLAVHSYEAIDWAIVHAIGSRHLVDFEDFARAVA